MNLFKHGWIVCTSRKMSEFKIVFFRQIWTYYCTIIMDSPCDKKSVADSTQT